MPKARKKMTKIITASEAAEILNLSRQRISQLLKTGRIGTRDTGIEYDKVIQYRDSRTNGRPEGTYKKP